MAQVKLKNFQAAASKRNMKDFGLFPVDRDLSWIQDANAPSFTTNTATFGSTITFNYGDGQSWLATLTADVSTSQILNQGSAIAFTDGNVLILKVAQDATGGWIFPLPSTVRAFPGYELTTVASTMTTFLLQWRSGGWDMIGPPVITPVT